MNVLGIETSCDDTAAAVVVNGTDVRSSTVSSQVDAHREFGGVVPELAAREHLRNIRPVVDLALAEAGLTIPDVDAVAATCAPGLIPSLLVGLSFAKGTALAGGIPLVPVNHLAAHIYSAFLIAPELIQDASAYPALALVVSGGHTSLRKLDADGTLTTVGRTLDDAAGEAFDKGAKILNLGYPGGPVIDRLATDGDAAAYTFPRGLTGAGGKAVSNEDRCNFSFSGLKTALMYETKDRTVPNDELPNLAASYQAAIVDVLVKKTLDAAAEFDTPTVMLCGGVACNSRLRHDMQAAVEAVKKRLVIAPPKYCMDNAAMVGGAGYFYLKARRISDLGTDAAARDANTIPPLPFTPQFEGGTLS